jgi:hypothetical protein
VPVTGGLRRVDWPPLGASVLASCLLTTLMMLPLLFGVGPAWWLLVLVAGAVLGVWHHARTARVPQPGPDADEHRFER